MAEAARLAGLAADEELARALSTQRSERLSVAQRRAPGGDLASRHEAPAEEYVERRPPPAAAAASRRPSQPPKRTQKKRWARQESSDEDEAGSDGEYVPPGKAGRGRGGRGGGGEEDESAEEYEDDDSDDDDDGDSYDDDVVAERVVNGEVVEVDDDEGSGLEDGEIDDERPRKRLASGRPRAKHRSGGGGSSSGGNAPLRGGGRVSARKRRRERTARLDQAAYNESDEEAEEHGLSYGLLTPGRLWKRLFEHQRVCLEWLVGLQRPARNPPPELPRLHT